MAIFHLSARSPIARSAGRSATAAAAYRAAVLIADDRTGEVHNYTRKRGVVCSALVLPRGARVADRAAFWNSVEDHHRRGDAVLAREVIIALPDELDAGKRRALAEQFARDIADRFEIAVDVSLHAPDRHGDARNHHAHLLLTACHVDAIGKLGKKAVALDPISCSRARAEDSVDWMRPAWECLVNHALARAGRTERVDHRSNNARGIDAVPGEHEGWGAGRELREQRNDERRRSNSEARVIDLEVATLLRTRAQAAAAEKIEKANALARAEAVAAKRAAVTTYQRLSEIEREFAAVLNVAAAAVNDKPRALPESVVRRAKFELPRISKAAGAARLRVDELEKQLFDLHRWRWLRRRMIDRALADARAIADRLSSDARETKKDAYAPIYEQVRKQQQDAEKRAFELAAEREQIKADTRVEASAFELKHAPVPRKYLKP